ncbi:peptidase M23 [Aliidiomarina sedimenti]|uniref:Peptidase M23 n=1 Tax=Aliidiomarina sedimenti TaxID=1933879 RepID=A0ABY0C3U9_9GAMM|nr:peptidoglycan DD-metalloendopeptidase family protein [Aliidiomarina sedimenti]RUO32293.1 peptidase M23 [Aliidiomarina sedimenti]
MRLRATLLFSIFTIATLSGCAQRGQPAPVDAVYQGRTVHDFARGSLSSNTYQVQRGDTLYSIAFRAEMDLRDVARLNNLQEPYQIFPGQVLRLDRQAASRPVAIAQSAGSQTTNSPNSSSERKNSVNNDLNGSVASNIEQEYGENRTVQQNNATQRSSSSAQTPSRQMAENGDIEWQWPSQGRIVQRFSTNRPGANGIQFSGLKGDPVTAAAAGKVVYVGSALRGFGRLIILKHNDDYITAYAHNDELMVEEQQWVSAGQQIATMGDSDADDVRLRFELRYQGSSVNPEQYLPRSR